MNHWHLAGPGNQKSKSLNREADLYRKFKRNNQTVWTGNNKTGRTGKLRCETCRVRHIKVYTSMPFQYLTESVCLSLLRQLVLLVKNPESQRVSRDGARWKSLQKGQMGIQDSSTTLQFKKRNFPLTNLHGRFLQRSVLWSVGKNVTCWNIFTHCPINLGHRVLGSTFIND